MKEDVTQAVTITAPRKRDLALDDRIQAGVAALLYRQQPDGTWKYHWSTFNSNEE